MEIVFQIAAMLLSPLIALQVSQRLTTRKEKQKRRLDLFHALMATRGSANSTGRLSREHVQALNMIDIEFHGDKRARPILEAWKAYLDHLLAPTPTTDAEWTLWNTRRDDLMVDLLYTMSQRLGYSFDKTHIRRTTYAPQGYQDLDTDSFIMRKLLLDVLSGKRVLYVSTPPAGEDTRAFGVVSQPALAANTSPALGPGSSAESTGSEPGK